MCIYIYVLNPCFCAQGFMEISMFLQEPPRNGAIPELPICRHLLLSQEIGHFFGWSLHLSGEAHDMSGVLQNVGSSVVGLWRDAKFGNEVKF